jgi:Transposase IS116/IS110/IS902 family
VRPGRAGPARTSRSRTRRDTPPTRDAVGGEGRYGIEERPNADAIPDQNAHGGLAVLNRASSPAEAARLSLAKVRSALKHAGRQRNLDARAQEIVAMLRTDQLTAPPAITAAFAATTRAAVGIIGELNRQIVDLEAELATHFEAHPDADICLSLPGLGVILGARVLGEFGDDPNRYTTAKSRKNYAGTSPLTVASGKKHAVLARRVRNRRLYDALDQWALCALTNSPGARDFYDQQRAAGDLHNQALRALGNRLVGILHGCLRHHTHYNEHIAWSHRTAIAA